MGQEGPLIPALFDTTEESRENKPCKGKGQKQACHTAILTNLNLLKVFSSCLDVYSCISRSVQLIIISLHLLTSLVIQNIEDKKVSVKKKEDTF